MTVSYHSQGLRTLCSLLYEVGDTVFSSEEILLIRSLISDLRASPNLNETPFKIELDQLNTGESIYTIEEDQIAIIFRSISKLNGQDLNRIKRIQILDIRKIDLQIMGVKSFSV